jgi:hypothetical protein
MSHAGDIGQVRPALLAEDGQTSRIAPIAAALRCGAVRVKVELASGSEATLP